ncbi:MAG: YmdB family metallophosphoesterase [Clostridia bacterium]|nr:YmdB family metallophosphoesterase [Clostridia bacterium]
MKILVIGDVTGPSGIAHLKENLWRIREREGADFVVVNAENAAFITGVSPEGAEILFSAGADVLTGGNHTMQNKLAYSYLDQKREMLRPINFPAEAPGNGWCITEAKNGYRVLVINAMGNVHIEPQLDSPYPYIDRALAQAEGRYDLAVLDFHAEATGEKGAVGYNYDGKISVIFGTHTHVPTADIKILPSGSGFITDVGMCGESGGILGMDAESVVEKMKTRLPVKFKAASGTPVANAALFTVDVGSGRCTDVKRFDF